MASCRRCRPCASATRSKTLRVLASSSYSLFSFISSENTWICRITACSTYGAVDAVGASEVRPRGARGHLLLTRPTRTHCCAQYMLFTYVYVDCASPGHPFWRCVGLQFSSWFAKDLVMAKSFMCWFGCRLSQVSLQNIDISLFNVVRLLYCRRSAIRTRSHPSECFKRLGQRNRCGGLRLALTQKYPASSRVCLLHRRSLQRLVSRKGGSFVWVRRKSRARECCLSNNRAACKI